MKPPFEVLIKGPAAVAAWFERQEGEQKRKADDLLDRHRKVLFAAGLEGPESVTQERIAIAIGACLLTATIIAYASKDGMRGPARDAISDLLDGCFDTIDDVEEKSAPFREAVAALRRAR